MGKNYVKVQYFSYLINPGFTFCMIMGFDNCQFLWQLGKVYLDAY